MSNKTTEILAPWELKIKEELNINAVKICRFLPLPTIERSHNSFPFPAFRRWENAFLAVRRDLSTEAIVNGLGRYGYSIEMRGSLDFQLGQESELPNAVRYIFDI